jgi:membrane protein
MKPDVVWAVLREAYVKSVADRVPRMGAALAFYMTFSLAPLLVIVIAIAGLVFGRQAAEGRLISEIGSLVGDEAATTLQFLISSADRQGSGVVASVIGGLVILVGAIGLFCEVRDAGFGPC